MTAMIRVRYSYRDRQGNDVIAVEMSTKDEIGMVIDREIPALDVPLEPGTRWRLQIPIPSANIAGVTLYLENVQQEDER